LPEGRQKPGLNSASFTNMVPRPLVRQPHRRQKGRPQTRAVLPEPDPGPVRVCAASEAWTRDATPPVGLLLHEPVPTGLWVTGPFPLPWAGPTPPARHTGTLVSDVLVMAPMLGAGIFPSPFDTLPPTSSNPFLQTRLAPLRVKPERVIRPPAQHQFQQIPESRVPMRTSLFSAAGWPRGRSSPRTARACRRCPLVPAPVRTTSARCSFLGARSRLGALPALRHPPPAYCTPLTRTGSPHRASR